MGVRITSRSHPAVAVPTSPALVAARAQCALFRALQFLRAPPISRVRGARFIQHPPVPYLNSLPSLPFPLRLLRAFFHADMLIFALSFIHPLPRSIVSALHSPILFPPLSPVFASLPSPWALRLAVEKRSLRRMLCLILHQREKAWRRGTRRPSMLLVGQSSMPIQTWTTSVGWSNG